MTQPKITDMVVIHGFHSNGSDKHAAVVTRVWSRSLVNLMVFPDHGQPTGVTSVAYYGDETEADDALRQLRLASPSVAHRVCHPPTLVV